MRLKKIQNPTSSTILAFILFALTCRPTLAADAPRAGEITVVGQGEVKAKPSTMEVSAEVAGVGELASDAVAKFKDAKRRALASPDELKMPGLTVESQGFSFWEGHEVQEGEGQAENGETAPKLKSSVRAVEHVRWVLKGLDKMQPEEVLQAMAKLSDAVHDLGLTASTTNETDAEGQRTSMFLFRLADAEAVRERARKLAIDDAAARAGRIAAQAGGKLGKIVSIREDRFDLNAGMESDASGAADEPLARRNAMGEIPIRAQVTMTFEFEPAAEKPAEK